MPLQRSAALSPKISSQQISSQPDSHFYYFAYGSCMCPVDLKRSLQEATHDYVIGPATLADYRLGFFRRSRRRNCGVLDVVPDAGTVVEGVLYRLPWRLSAALDQREEGYRQAEITVTCGERQITNVRTYTVLKKHTQELAPNDWYFTVVMRGAITCGLSEDYRWRLFHHMHQLQVAAQGLPPQYGESLAAVS